MDFSNEVQRRVFFEIHTDLPREAPGSREATLKALSLILVRLPERPLIADMGCGPGSSVIPLAMAMPLARFIALDLHAPFVEEVRRRVSAAGLVEPERIEAKVADMGDPPVKPGSLDLIWCEGAIYFLGVEDGLRKWRDYLTPDGFVVFNEPVWLVPPDDRPEDLTKMWEEYPAMTDGKGILEAIKKAGYEPIGAFDLPDADWWTPYFTPMEDKLDRLEAEYQGDADAAVPLKEARDEIDIRRRYPDKYAYRFYAVRIV